MPTRLTLVNNAHQQQRAVVVLRSPTLETLRTACKNKLRLKGNHLRFFDEVGTELVAEGFDARHGATLLCSAGEAFIGAGIRTQTNTAEPHAVANEDHASVPATILGVATGDEAEEVLLPGEKGTICWIRVGGGRLALWHRPGGKACPKLHGLAGATHLCTLLAEREGAEGIGRQAEASGLLWMWHALDGADAEYLETDEAIETLTAAAVSVGDALAAGGSVLVHCSAGVHRTGSLGYAVLRANGRTREQALEGLRAMRQVTADGVDQMGRGNARGGGRTDLVERRVVAAVMAARCAAGAPAGTRQRASGDSARGDGAGTSTSMACADASSDIELHIFDVDEAFCDAAADAFAGTSVAIHHAPLSSCACDAVVHAGNAHGIIAGGQDRAFIDLFGPPYQLALDTALRTHFDDAIQPVDEALMISTSHPIQRWVVHVRCFPHNSETAFIALSAALRHVRRHNTSGAWPSIRSLACSGLGTYGGCSHAAEAALQMRAAYDLRDVGPHVL